MSYPKIEIKTKTINDSPAYTEIFINGHKIDGVRRFSLSQEAGNNYPVLTIDLNALNLATDVGALVIQEGIGNIQSIEFDTYGKIDFN